MHLCNWQTRTTHHLHFQMIKHTGGLPMFLKKTPKAKGTYLAITESYYDKEKKATRQKTIMGSGISWKI